MSKSLWEEVEKKIRSHDYMAGVERTVARIKATGEIFTPTELVVEMLKNTPSSAVKPGKKVIDPACGDGQFLVGVKWLKILKFGMTERAALNDIFGVDIMKDNVEICRRRLNGGSIIHGNILEPETRLKGQSEKDYRMMIDLFSEQFLLL